MRTLRFRIWHDKRKAWVWDAPGAPNLLGECNIMGYILGMDEKATSITELNDLIVEQFTGLYDSTKWEDLTEKQRGEWSSWRMYDAETWKGFPIFEGDTLEYTDLDSEIPITEILNVEWSDEATGYIVQEKGEKQFFSLFIVKGCCKVIGNIHELQ